MEIPSKQSDDEPVEEFREIFTRQSSRSRLLLVLLLYHFAKRSEGRFEFKL